MRNAAPLIGRGNKDIQYYKGLRVKADPLLHAQIHSYIKSLHLAGRPAASISVLDMGCGEGALSQLLFDEGFNVVSVDMDDKSFKAQGPTFEKVDFNHAAERERFIEKYRGRTFDVVLAIEIIEHVRNPWDLFASLAAIAADTTDIIITTPNISSWWGRLWFFLRGELWGFSNESWHDPGHINPIGAVEISHMAEENGFTVQKLWAGGELPIVWLYNWKRLAVSLIFLCLRPLMSGFRDGWVLCAHVRKRS